jgi:hydrogenase nickel incorporation protein HypA/HybF
MHELSIANSIIDLASEVAASAGARRVTAVHIRIGSLAGVAAESLTFCYEVASRGTLLDGSRLVVESAPVVIHCPSCERDVELEDLLRFVCPRCGTPTADVRSGRELEIESIEVS